MDLLERLNTVIFPEAVGAGCFGDNVKKFIRFKVSSHPGTEQYCSDSTFGHVLLERKTGFCFGLPVFVKTRNRSKFPTEAEANTMFHNEILFYKTIVPFLRKYDRYDVLTTSFPEFLYGKAGDGHNPEDDFIVLNDLRHRGFRRFIGKHLDENHFQLIMDRAGKFHGLSILWRDEDPDGFAEVTGRIKLLDEAQLWADFGEIKCKKVFREYMFRGVEPLREDPAYRDRLAGISGTLERAHERVDECMVPSGPLTALIQGDFHVNNMMFKYGADGTPVEVAFVDFGIIKLCSPAVDLCRVAFFSMSPQMKRDHWNQLLHQYHDSLCRQIGDHRLKPSFETVDVDIRTKGIHSYCCVATVMPMVISLKEGVQVPQPPTPTNLDPGELQEAIEAYVKRMKELGGADVTEFLVDIVRHMVDKQFIFDG
nr:PREDICTED: uncharacterized protein LOC109031934 [Bemisia tabaci]